ncbi:MAG: lipoyl(octanoyl) transferase LipB [Crocinitomicaceae bacterium]|jgi:lipoyl(octanoyl) transferase|nr:lipoyl(octanoyl) transferase LipB [Crocinitomicaceae bacterium]MDG2332577.1 lipoyl(octanoyl) transferase LipB [Flavobacteriales bacterium]
MRKVHFEDLGLIDFKKAWDYQTNIFQKSIELKVENRKNPANGNETQNHLLFCEHPHVYTVGNSGNKDHLLLSDSLLKEKDASYYKINRGGDITYHGPGQLVAYPIFDLDHFFTDIHKYLRFLEEVVIITLKEFGINAGRLPGFTGVWIEPNSPSRARKICAMGVKCSRWVTMHGIGFNINSDLDYFGHIIPCGIEGKQVTSMQKEIGETVDQDNLKATLKTNFANVFDFDYY